MIRIPRFSNHASLRPWALLFLSWNPSAAEVIAATDFDGRVVAGNTASNLNWTTLGVSDPGEMSAFVFTGAAANLFDNTADNQNSFVPAINTGNGNTSWTTSVSLTPLPGFSVTLEEVTFDYLAMSAAGVINVPRRSDFTVTLSSPAGTELATASIEDVISGTGLDPVIAPVVLTLDPPITLSETGTYQLVIRGGDFLGFDETGNHTGIDQLSINGTIGGSAGGLSITQIELNVETGKLTLQWNSVSGQGYLIRTSPDLLDWEKTLATGIPADEGETTTFTYDLNDLSGGFPAASYFRVEVDQ